MVVKSRYGDRREYKITPKGIEIAVYNSMFARMGYIDDNSTKISFIDFEGGPFLEVGQTLDFNKKSMYTITGFKELRSNKRKKTSTWLLLVDKN